MTQDNWMSARRWVWSFVLVIAAVAGGFAGGLYVGLPSPAAAAAVADRPEGLVKGAFFIEAMHPNMVELQYEVQEVRGDWVRTTVIDIRTNRRFKNVWVNLRTVQVLSFPGLQ